MAASVEFVLLGHVEARSDGRPVDLGHARQRSLLAVLLIEANRGVPTDQLIERAWGDHHPRRPHDTLYSYLSRLRRVLATSGDAELIRDSIGYCLRVDEEAVDYHRFQRLVRQARDTSRADAAAGLFERALRLWRAEPLGGLDTPWFGAVRARLEGERFRAELDHADCALRAGQHAGLLPELLDRAVAYPLDERVAGQLLLALYRSGRQAEALAHYDRMRVRLADELGVDPGPALRELHLRILRGAAELAAPRGVAVAGEGVPDGRELSGRVAMLPADIADFIGRGALVDGVTERLTAAAGAVPVVVLAGRAGVGKTALAVYAAHRVSARFAGGQLYVDLRGADPNPADPRSVLGRFLRALGVDASVVPDGTDERAELYRGLLAARRMLVVLDNAASSAQVKPLIPGASGCAVLITSRSRLAEVPGAELFDVEPPPGDDSVALLARIAGADRVQREPDAAAAIVRLCGQLPLAVRIAGARLARHRHWPLAKLAERLSDEQRRLDELAAGDLDVRASFALSYQALDADAARVLRLLALLDADEVGAWVAGPLLQVDADRPEALVDALVDCYLLDFVDDGAGQSRFRMHDLVRLFARERSAVEDTEADRRAALERVFAAWLGLAKLADGRLPSRRLAPVHGTALRQPPRELERLVDDPLAWFDGERANLVAAVDQAAAMGMTELSWDIAGCCVNFLDLRDLYDDWNRTHRSALAACQRSGDRRGEAVALRGLGDLASMTPLARVGDYLGRTRRASELFHECDERSAEADALVVLGNLHRLQGRNQQARSCLRAAATLAQDGVHEATQTSLWLIYGFIEQELGRYEQAIAFAHRCLRLAESNGWRVQQADALQLLGSLHASVERTVEGIDFLNRALAIAVELGHLGMQAWVSCVLGGRYLSLHEYREAHGALDRAGALFDRLGLTSGQSAVLRWRGELALAEGDPPQAVAHLESCLVLARRNHTQYLEAAALKALGGAQHATGDEGSARVSWRHARDLFVRIGNEREASEIEQLMTVG